MQDWKLFALGSAVFAGLTAIFGKIGVKNIPSNLATFLRTVVVVSFIGIILFVRKEWRNPIELDKRSLIFLVLSSFATGLSWLCYYRALQTGPASMVSVIDKFSLFFAVVLAVLFLGERLSVNEWIGAALVLAGTLVTLFK